MNTSSSNRCFIHVKFLSNGYLGIIELRNIHEVKQCIILKRSIGLYTLTFYLIKRERNVRLS